jgi:hypothetical protein
MQNQSITKTTIAKVDGEYIVRAYVTNGQGLYVRQFEADYYASDLDDAKGTAKAMTECSCKQCAAVEVV